MSQAERQAQARRMTEGKEALWAKEIDPDGTLSPDELAQQLAARWRAHMSAVRLARKRRGGDDAA
jgi:hypothetical protein